MKTLYWWMCVAMLVAGCGSADGSSTGGTSGSGSTGGAAANGGAGGTGGASLPQVLDPVDGDPAYAVVITDYNSTAVSLLDEHGDVVVDEWLTSGSTWPGLVAALSGDVALPTKQMGDGSIVVIDRFDIALVSRFDIPTGGLYGQVRTQGQSSIAAFFSDPHDCAFVSETSAWVTRHQPSFEPSPAPDVAGNDLLEIDPATMTLTGGRVDLSVLNDEVNGVTIYARPDRIVRLGDFFVVGLAGMNDDFTIASSGRVAVVEIESGAVTEVPLASARNCWNVVPVPNASDRAIVACRGASPTFDPLEQRMTAGLYVLQIEEGEASIVRAWRPADDEDSATTVEHVIALNDREAIAVANGDFLSGTPDRAYVLDLVSGVQTFIFESTGSFEIGPGEYDADRELLLIPVSSEGVRRYTGSSTDFTFMDTVEVSKSAGFGPRFVSSLR